MNRRNTLHALMIGAAAAAGTAATMARADLPKAQRVNVKDMDVNRNGRIEKDEYLAFMGRMFDQAAGVKGYCTFEEVADGFKRLNDVHHGS